MTVKEIVRQYLKAYGFDGLRNENIHCWCMLDDLSPDYCMSGQCEPGYRAPCGCGEDCDFHIVPRRAGEIRFGPNLDKRG
jgi:hypothetical protein